MGLFDLFKTDDENEDREGYDGGLFNWLNPDFGHLQGDATHRGLQREEGFFALGRAASDMDHESQGGEHGEAMVWWRGAEAERKREES